MSNERARAEIVEAIGAHGAWKLRLRTAIGKGALDVPSSEIARDDACRFGKWLAQARRDPAIARSPDFAEVERLHREFHVCAGKIARRIEAGDARGAQGEIAPGSGFDAASTALSRAMMAWKARLG